VPRKMAAGCKSWRGPNAVGPRDLRSWKGTRRTGPTGRLRPYGFDSISRPKSRSLDFDLSTPKFPSRPVSRCRLRARTVYSYSPVGAGVHLHVTDGRDRRRPVVFSRSPPPVRPPAPCTNTNCLRAPGTPLLVGGAEVA